MRDKRRAKKQPGGPKQSEKRADYLRLIKQGYNNSSACRAVGVNRKTGNRLN